MIDTERLEAHINNGEREYILCAAIWVETDEDYIFKPFNVDKGLVYSGWRHPQILEIIPKEYRTVRKVQGFLTNKNRFLNRHDSLELVKENGQLQGETYSSFLTSEDLW